MTTTTDGFFGPPPALFERTVPYHQSSAVYVPRAGGVYLIRDDRGPLYVGRSQNLRQRFESHYWIAENRRLRQAVARPWGEIQFAWIEVGEDEQGRLEAAFVRALNPRCNVIRFKTTHNQRSN